LTQLEKSFIGRSNGSVYQLLAVILKEFKNAGR